MRKTPSAHALRSGSRQVMRLLEIASGVAIVTPSRAPSGLNPLSDMLAALRETLQADVVFVARFDEARRRFIAVSKSRDEMSGVEAGDSDPVLDTYCRLVVERRIPAVVTDTHANPLTAALPITQSLGIAAYVSAPVYRTDGHVFGTLCAIYHQTQPGLHKEIGKALRELADALGKSLTPEGTFEQMTWTARPAPTSPAQSARPS